MDSTCYAPDIQYSLTSSGTYVQAVQKTRWSEAPIPCIRSDWHCMLEEVPHTRVQKVVCTEVEDPLHNSLMLKKQS